MSTAYRVYGNGGSGGPIDYSTPLQDGPSLTFSLVGIAPGAWAFGVRAHDTVSGLEEMNTDAIVNVIIGSDHLDHTAVPNSPQGLTATALAGGSIKLDWMYVSEGQGGSPTGFSAWAWPGSVDWSISPSATLAVSVPRGQPSQRFTLTITGLTPGVTYTIGIRATNPSGNDGNTTTVSATLAASGPSPVGSLSGSASYAVA